MPESRIAQLATSPLLTQFAITASQKAIRPVGNFLAPLCEVPDINFRYKVYDDKNRFRIPSTRRNPGSPVTRLGFSADDASGTLTPNALDFPIPNVEGLSDEALSYSIMEAQGILSDVSALALENEQLATAVNALTATKISFDPSDDSLDPIGDPTYGLDAQCLAIVKAAKNGAPVKILFGTNAFRKARNNKNVRSRFIVSNRGGGGSVGAVSPTISDIGLLLMTNPEVQISMMVIDTSAPGTSEAIQFLLDDSIIIFAANSAPNRMDPSFMKTFAPMGGFFKPGTGLPQLQPSEQRVSPCGGYFCGLDKPTQTPTGSDPRRG